MTTTDSIFFIKETRTCQYTLVIHTPRLCGEPGFRSPRDDLQDTPLRCRKIVNSLDEVDQTLPDSSLPFHRPQPKPLPAPRTKPASGGESASGNGNGNGEAGKTGTGANQGNQGLDKKAHAIRAALDSLFGRINQNGANNNKNAPQGGGEGATQPKPDQGGQNANGDTKLGDLGEGIIVASLDENGEIRIDKLLDDGDGKFAAFQDDDDGIVEIELAGGEDATRLLKILRDAGYDARLPGKDEEDKEEPLKSHDEL
jgi:protein OS-9